jgi:hypothetical protein
VNDTQPPERPPVTITIRPGSTPARELPHGMVSNVADVLEVYGLQFRAASEQDPTLWATLLGLIGEIVDRVPQDFGGSRLPPPPWIDPGSGPGWSPDPDTEEETDQ